ncbi:MAG: hypothetical protein ACE5OS_13310 [Anaerolineae bacterium]
MHVGNISSGIRFTGQGISRVVVHEVGVQVLRVVQRLRCQRALRWPGDEGAYLGSPQSSVRGHLLLESHDLTIRPYGPQHDQIAGVREVGQAVKLSGRVGCIAEWL